MAISNSSFESGTFFGWQTIGSISIETEEFGVTPTDGEFQALLTTSASDSGGPVLSSDLGDFLDFPVPLDIPFNADITEGSAIKQTLSLEAGDILTFDFNFLTNETIYDQNPDTYNDFAFYTLVSGDMAPDVEKLADTGDTVFSSSTSFDTETQYISFEILRSGTYTLGFGVVDVDDADDSFDSALLIDNLQIISSDELLPERPPLG